MIPNAEKWHYLGVKKLPVLSRGILSIHHSDFYCLNYFRSFATENKRESHRNKCETKDFCNIVMLFGDNKILEFI